MRIIPIAICLGAVSFAAEMPKKNLDLQTAKSKIEFLAIGRPSMLKIRGEAKPEGATSALSGKLIFEKDAVKGSATFALDSLDTANGLRNRHMKEKYLETAKFPKAELTLTELKLPEALRAGDGEVEKVPFKGTLTVHGVGQPIEGTVDIEKKEGRVELDFAFGTKIPNHKIELPSFMGVTVAEDVKITVEVEGPLT